MRMWLPCKEFGFRRRVGLSWREVQSGRRSSQFACGQLERQWRSVTGTAGSVRGHRCGVFLIQSLRGGGRAADSVEEVGSGRKSLR